MTSARPLPSRRTLVAGGLGTLFCAACTSPAGVTAVGPSTAPSSSSTTGTTPPATLSGDDRLVLLSVT